MKIATLNWDDNTESDLAGYHVYREGNRIATVGLVSSYVDTTVPDAALSASYYVTAFDTTGNESAPSQTVTKFYEIPKLHKFTITESQDKVVVSWKPTDYPRVTAPRRTTKSLVTITIAKA